MMTDLNEFECEMLDVLLEAFGVPDNLTRLQIMQLFNDDEALAYAMVRALLREGLVGVAGNHGDFELPDRLVLMPKGERFLKEGGFMRRFKDEQKKPLEVGGTLAKLQQQNMKLQNLKLANEIEIGNLKKELQQGQTLKYLLFALVVVGLILGFVLGRTL
ncbi:hypothetical protein [uncultured Mucilaginibacter sp.]|uniref:hypothetical protein n=1 Tax=uncultured Mucilaginibacter sp. TaxID=797541 RepID=UPI0025E40738|nr:hypothetical protein [uncultured Mucilaginibacter sp.]